MSARDLLWELVHALNKAEKQRFKSRSYQWTRGNYNQNVEFFDAIQRMTERPSQERFRKPFRNHTIGKRLGQKTKELYRTILRYAPETEPDSDSQLAMYLAQAKFLLRKGLYNHLPTLLQEALALADKTESFSEHLDLLDVLREESRRRVDKRFLATVTDTLHPLEETLLEKYNNIKAYNRLLDNARRLLSLPRTERLKEVAELQQHPLLASEEKCLSDRARIYFYWIGHFIAVASGQIEKARKPLQRVIKICEIRTELMQDQSLFSTLVMAYGNSGLIANALRDFEHARKIAAKMRSLSASSRDEQLFIAERVSKLEAGIIADEFRPELGIKIAAGIEKNVRDFVGQLDNQILVELAFLLSRYYLIARNFKMVIVWGERVVQPDLLNVQTEFVCICKIHQLIALYESADLDRIERETRKAAKLFQKVGFSGPVQDAILGFFSTYVSIQTESTLRHRLSEFADSLDDSVGSTPNVEQLGKFLRTWIESKLSGNTLVDVLKKNRN